jgi:hypothetical protein
MVADPDPHLLELMDPDLNQGVLIVQLTTMSIFKHLKIC